MSVISHSVPDRSEATKLLDLAADSARGALLHGVRAKLPWPRPAGAASGHADVALALDRIGSLAGPAPCAPVNPVAPHPILAGAVTPLARLTLALRSRPDGDRRRLPRFPHCMPCRLEIDGHAHVTETLDIGRRGTLVKRPPYCRAVTGTRGRATLAGIGTIAVRITSCSPDSLNLVACGPMLTAVEAALDGLMLRLKGENDFLAGRVRNFAATLASRFETALRTGETDLASLFDRQHLPVAGTFPQQYTTQALPFYERILPGILARFFDPRSGTIYAIATDRDGYVPVHNTPFSQPQRPDDPAFNRLYSRHRRIYDDMATLRAARFSGDVIIQSYARDIDGPGAMVKSMAAPVFVNGRRWGCAGIAFALKFD